MISLKIRLASFFMQLPVAIFNRVYYFFIVSSINYIFTNIMRCVCVIGLTGLLSLLLLSFSADKNACVVSRQAWLEIQYSLLTHIFQFPCEILSFLVSRLELILFPNLGVQVKIDKALKCASHVYTHSILIERDKYS